MLLKLKKLDKFSLFFCVIEPMCKKKLTQLNSNILCLRRKRSFTYYFKKKIKTTNNFISLKSIFFILIKYNNTNFFLKNPHLLYFVLQNSKFHSLKVPINNQLNKKQS